MPYQEHMFAILASSGLSASIGGHRDFGTHQAEKVFGASDDAMPDRIAAPVEREMHWSPSQKPICNRQEQAVIFPVGPIEAVLEQFDIFQDIVRMLAIMPKEHSKSSKE